MGGISFVVAASGNRRITALPNFSRRGSVFLSPMSIVRTYDDVRAFGCAVGDRRHHKRGTEKEKEKCVASVITALKRVPLLSHPR